MTNKWIGRKKADYERTPSSIHWNLSRALSSIEIRMRSENIGSNSFLHQREVPYDGNRVSVEEVDVLTNVKGKENSSYYLQAQY